MSKSSMLTDRLPIEDPGVEFPFYAGQPVRLSYKQWLFVLAMLAIGFSALFFPVPMLPIYIAQFVAAGLFCGLPLLALWIVAPGHWTALMRKVKTRDILLMFGIAALTIIVSMVVGLVASSLFEVAENPINDQLSHLSRNGTALMFLATVVQLFGEELLTILPFLALLSLFHEKLGWSRKSAVWIAWLLSCVIFGLAHLSTYNWHIMQTIVVIGTARFCLTFAYIKTKNLWVSTGAHILNDWTFFAITLLASR